MAKKATGINKKMNFSDELYEVTGKERGSRGEATKWIWDYIKKHDLQNPNNKRNILPDATLKGVLPKREVTMFEIGKYLTKHLSE